VQETIERLPGRHHNLMTYLRSVRRFSQALLLGTTVQNTRVVTPTPKSEARPSLRKGSILGCATLLGENMLRKTSPPRRQSRRRPEKLLYAQKRQKKGDYCGREKHKALA